MKKYLFLVIALVGLVGFSGCRKTEVIETAIMPNRTYIRELSSNGWQREANNLIYFDIPLQDLTEYYVLEGSVSIALSFDDEATYDILPTNFSGVAYSVNYTVGSVRIYAQDPLDEDFTIDPPTGVVVAKIVLSDADFIN